MTIGQLVHPTTKAHALKSCDATDIRIVHRRCMLITREVHHSHASSSRRWKTTVSTRCSGIDLSQSPLFNRSHACSQRTTQRWLCVRKRCTRKVCVRIADSTYKRAGIHNLVIAWRTAVDNKLRALLCVALLLRENKIKSVPLYETQSQQACFKKGVSAVQSPFLALSTYRGLHLSCCLDCHFVEVPSALN